MAKTSKPSSGSSKKAKSGIVQGWTPKNRAKSKKTSVGASCNSRPLNKNKRRNHKAYRGQGR